MAEPNIDYTSRDFEGMKSSLLDYASKRMPEWTSRSEGDFGVVMAELFAYAHDVQSYYIDRAQLESYLPTATQRLSILNLAATLGYVPHGPVPATGQVRLITPNPGPAVTLPAGTPVMTDYIDELDAPIIYETDTTVLVPANGDPENPDRYVTVDVTQGQTQRGVALGDSTGDPEQEFRLPHASVLDGTVQVSVQGLWGPEPWAPITYLVDADPTDQVFTTYTDAAGACWVRFGDGVNGAIPQQGLAITATYRVGGGAFGNVAAGKVTSMAADIGGVTIATDPDGVPYTTAMTGGADPESLESIRANAPLAYRTQDRAVTPDDFSQLALRVPGVTKASAVAAHYTSVTLYIAGHGGLEPSARLKSAVQDYFSTRTLAGVSLTVASAVIVPMNFGAAITPMTLQVHPMFSQPTVQAEVERAIQRLVSIENVQFGGHIALSEVYAAVQEVPGVVYFYIPVLARADQQQILNSLTEFRPSELPTLGNLYISASGGIVEE